MTGVGRDLHGAATELDGARHRGHRSLGIRPWDVGYSDEPAVSLAEGGHSPVVGGRSAVEKIEIVAEELGRREGGEHQLPLEAENVQCPAPLRWVEGPQGVPALRLHQGVFQ